MIHVVSVCVGTKYPREYVEILHDMLARNLSQLAQVKHWSVTDHIIDGVERIDPDPTLPGWWQKVRLFSPKMPWRRGERIIYFDLDTVVVGRLEDLAERSGIIRDWHWPCYNSSVMSWLHGEHEEVWTRFDPAIIDRPTNRLAHLLPRGQINGGDQEWITECGGWETFPAEWFVSSRQARNWPPAGAKAVIYHGSPKPHEIIDGWVTQAWKIGGLTSLPKMTGMNVSHEFALDNVRANAPRDLPWFSGFGKQDKPLVIVGGAPSMLKSIDSIKLRKRQGAKVIALNNAWRPLMARGVKPDGVVMLDARPENVEFVKGAPAGFKWFLASQCHPDVFDALQGHDVIVWHNLMGENEALHQILAPWWDGPNQKPIVGVPGGCTVGLRALWLAQLSGYRKVHVYGLDSSYAGERHHAYPQALNDGEATMQVMLAGNRYTCARWMARQAEEFQDHWIELAKLGVDITVHGSGLIPDMCRLLRQEAAA
jgi:hypothetical protein